MKKIFSAQPVWQQQGVLLLRLIVAALIIYHGWEIFDAEKMKGYTEWDEFKKNAVLPYLGKGAELVAGALLLPGLLTRVSTMIMIGTFGYICFFVGNGKFWYQDQHPFLFVLLGFFFFITGPGAASVDAILFKQQELQ